MSFLDKFCDILSLISTNNKLCYIAGDYNLDVLRCNNHSPTQEIIENLFLYMFVPLIDKPTRITAHSATLIDNIFTSNNLSDKDLNCIFVNDLSNHLPILSYSIDDSVMLKNQSNKAVRNYSEANVNRFRTCLSEINWSYLLSDQDPQAACKKFHSKYSTSLIWLLQKRAVRVITNSPYRTHSAPLFLGLKVLDIFKVNTFHIARFMFLYHNRLLPTSVLNLFVTNNQIHSHNTRNANSYRPHSCRTNIKQFTIRILY